MHMQILNLVGCEFSDVALGHPDVFRATQKLPVLLIIFMGGKYSGHTHFKFCMRSSC